MAAALRTSLAAGTSARDELQNGELLPTNQGFSSFFGMPITNVQNCGQGKSQFQGADSRASPST
jgi:hypothetical protein